MVEAIESQRSTTEAIQALTEEIIQIKDVLTGMAGSMASLAASMKRFVELVEESD